MNEPQNSHPGRWIALGALLVIGITGGLYRLHKYRAAGTSQNQASLPGSPSSLLTIGAGSGKTLPSDSKSGGTTGAGTPITATTASEQKLSGTQPGPQVGLAPLPGALPDKPAPADQCVTITYHHKPLATHPDDETCSHHKNMLTLQDTHINAQSVCVKVNGTPVHYLSVKGHADELIFGSVAGPKSVVTVRYCTGKAQGCVKEDCTVPKDEFMEAIGGAEGATPDAKLGQWDPTAPAQSEADVMAKLDGDVKKELETNDDLNGRAPAGEMFKDWIGQAQSAACGTQQAQN